MAAGGCGGLNDLIFLPAMTAGKLVTPPVRRQTDALAGST